MSFPSEIRRGVRVTVSHPTPKRDVRRAVRAAIPRDVLTIVFVLVGSISIVAVWITTPLRRQRTSS